MIRKLYCLAKDEVIVMKKSEFEKEIEDRRVVELGNVEKYQTVGPTFPDGSINWQCPCMAGGSMVAHRCGNYFRSLYICMKSDDKREPTEKCPNQFVDWAACIQNMSVEKREQMRKAMTMDTEKLGISSSKSS